MPDGDATGDGNAGEAGGDDSPDAAMAADQTGGAAVTAATVLCFRPNFGEGGEGGIVLDGDGARIAPRQVRGAAPDGDASAQGKGEQQDEGGAQGAGHQERAGDARLGADDDGVPDQRVGGAGKARNQRRRFDRQRLVGAVLGGGALDPVGDVGPAMFNVRQTGGQRRIGSGVGEGGKSQGDGGRQAGPQHVGQRGHERSFPPTSPGTGAWRLIVEKAVLFPDGRARRGQI